LNRSWSERSERNTLTSLAFLWKYQIHNVTQRLVSIHGQLLVETKLAPLAVIYQWYVSNVIRHMYMPHT